MKKFRISKLNRSDSDQSSVVVAVALAVMVALIFGLLIFSTFCRSTQVKGIEKNASDNFYGAEKVMEELCVELQADVSEFYNAAYTEVMAAYDTYDSAEEMQKAYEDKFLAMMEEKLCSVSGYYEVSAIQNYLEDRYDEEVVTIGAACVEEGGNVVYQNILEEVDGALYIRNIYVKYAEDGYSDAITTDIRIDVPSVTFAKISTMPAITDYAVIADSGIEMTGTKVYYTIEGKLFAGLLDPMIEGEEATGSIDISGGANVTLTSEEMVAEGDVEVRNGATFTADENTTIWANGVSTMKGTSDANSVSLLGKTYIKDDTTINGKNNTVTLGGAYYGYGGSATSTSDSSAIIINGTGTTLKMDSLDTMVLAGTSFVGTKGEAADKLGLNGDEVNTSDILMGDSVAVKTNQLIYMLPIECCVTDSGSSLGNPMTYSDYKKIEKTWDSWKKKALATTIRGLGRSISSYGNVDITPVFSNKQNGTVYLYLEFESAEAASEYFMDCYGSTTAGKKAKEYFENYLKAFSIKSSAQIQSAGNYLVQGSAGSAVYKEATAGIADVNLESIYDELIMQSSFQNVINEDDLKDYADSTVTDYKGKEFAGYEETTKVPSTVAGIEPRTVKVVLVDNEEEAYTIDGDFTGVLIATGDVKVTNSGANEINGLIICKGTLSMEGAGTKGAPTMISYDEEAVSYALRIANDEGIQVMSVFAGNEGSSAGSLTNGTVTETEKSDIRSCISFENWKTE